ncbi:hypothetical protein [Aestuariivivens sediminis]|uniref:hypothetical protein n=1 Tax=Aestuariivivens sediminis TaxID=2913557 RepID=UPI001F5929C2|nr:hypothetical protein [Aestuariivivens sediminis]
MKPFFFIVSMITLILSCNNTKQAEKEYIKSLEEKNELIQQELEEKNELIQQKLNDLENAYDDAIKDNQTVNIELEESRKRINEKIKELEPEKSNSNDYFTIGSTEKQVLEVMGTPTSYRDRGSLGKIMRFGLNSVSFENGKVVSYNNLDGNLKVRVKE